MDTTKLDFAYPKTSAQWWEQYAAVKDSIRTWGPDDHDINEDFIRLLISRGRDYLAEFYGEFRGKTLYQMMDELEANRDPRLARVLNFIWGEAPDKRYIHEWENWGRFCDLCSEAYVLVEDGVDI